MKELLFATTNTGKVASLQRTFDRAGMAVKVVPKAFDLIEEQADDALQVAESKARQAFALAGEPLVVDDSAFHIPTIPPFFVQRLQILVSGIYIALKTNL